MNPKVNYTYTWRQEANSWHMVETSEEKVEKQLEAMNEIYMDALLAIERIKDQLNG